MHLALKGGLPSHHHLLPFCSLYLFAFSLNTWQSCAERSFGLNLHPRREDGVTMPSFLTKVFGRKKDDKPSSTSHANKRASNGSLLEGKYESVSPTVSPSAANFADASRGHKDNAAAPGSPLALFRSRSRNPSDQPRASSVSSAPPPHLTLNLPVPKEEKSRALGVVFEADPDNLSTLSDAVVGERRLSPLETLLLVKACSEAIVNSGGEWRIWSRLRQPRSATLAPPYHSASVS